MSSRGDSFASSTNKSKLSRFVTKIASSKTAISLYFRIRAHQEDDDFANWGSRTVSVPPSVKNIIIVGHFIETSIIECGGKSVYTHS
jgi:hypothetical protein